MDKGRIIMFYQTIRYVYTNNVLAEPSGNANQNVFEPVRLVLDLQTYMLEWTAKPKLSCCLNYIYAFDSYQIIDYSVPSYFLSIMFDFNTHLHLFARKFN